MHLDNNELMKDLRHHIDSDESLYWVGKSKHGIILKGSDLFMIPFSLIWGGFAVFWEYTAIIHGTPLLFALFGIPFVLIGLYMIVGRFFYDMTRRENIIYGLTQNRIIIKSGVFRKTINSIYLKTLPSITLKEGAGGKDSIILGHEMGITRMFSRSGWSGTNNNMTPSIEMIPDVRKVNHQITQLLKNN